MHFLLFVCHLTSFALDLSDEFLGVNGIEKTMYNVNNGLVRWVKQAANV